jgi:hypothetical protein
VPYGEKQEKEEPKKVESEEDEYDLDFDKLSKKEMIKIKSLFKRL